MAKKITATKANYLKTKESLDFAKKGYNLLDKKRTVLVREMMRLNQRALDLQVEIEEAFARTYDFLTMASITMGWESLVDLSLSMPKEDEYEMGYRSVMGVEIPEVQSKSQASYGTFSIYETSFAFDRVYSQISELRKKVYELAQMETSLYRLAREIKKSAKRANALKKIQIPRQEKTLREISDILEEKEREDFFRLKRVKSKVSR